MLKKAYPVVVLTLLRADYLMGDISNENLKSFSVMRLHSRTQGPQEDEPVPDTL